MVWRTWRSRISGAPLLFLLVTLGLAYLLGLFTSAFFWEFVQLSYLSPRLERIDDDPQFRLLPVDLISFRQNCTDGKVQVQPENVKQFIIDNLFDGKSPFDEFPSPELLPLLRKQRIKGWGADAAVFERLMMEVRPAVVVELGSFLGASAMHMAQIARNLSLNATILCLDDFRGWPGFRDAKFKDIKIHNGENLLYHQFLKNIQYMNYTDYILPVPFSITSALLKFCEWRIEPDLIEIDGGHDFHSAWFDLNLASAILKPGGVMFGHDYFNRADGGGVRRAVDLFARLQNLKVEPDGQHWILRNSSFIPTNQTAASLLS